MSLTKSEILSKDDRTFQEVDVPEWGGSVRIASFAGEYRDAWEMSVANKQIKNIRARLVALSAVDDNGDLLFSDSDVDKLGKKSGKALDRVFSACLKLNGIGQPEVEDLAKN